MQSPNPALIRGLLKSIDVEPLSQHFIGKAVVSFRSTPFKGGLYQAYSWDHIIFLTPHQLKSEIISSLVDSVRNKQKRKLVAALAELRQRRQDEILA